MNRRELKRELKKIKKIITSRKTKQAVKRHFIFWDTHLNSLGDAITNGLIGQETPPIITVNKYYIRLKW